MPKRHRDRLKQKMAQAINDLDRAKEKVGSIWAEFDGVHDDYAASLVLLGQAIDLTRQGLVKFWEQAWGTVPADFNAYRR